MSHSCPDCGATCHCGGDIDDICFDHPPKGQYCDHCPDLLDDDDDDDDYSDWRGEEDDMTGHLRPCFVCRRQRPIQFMRRLAKALWICREPHDSLKEAR